MVELSLLSEEVFIPFRNLKKYCFKFAQLIFLIPMWESLCRLSVISPEKDSPRASNLMPYNITKSVHWIPELYLCEK